MAIQDTVAETITAQIPYLRGEHDRLYVEASSRDLGPEKIEHRTLEVRNGRAIVPSLDREGFQLCHSPSRVVREAPESLEVESRPTEIPASHKAYWDDTLPLIRELSGADLVLPLWSSRIRFSPRRNRGDFFTPAVWAHLDYDPEEAAVQLRETFERNGVPPRACRRYVLYQGWRALSPPPQDYPLALCDGRTVAEADIVEIDYRMNSEGVDVRYRSQGARYSPKHAWWYFPDMTPDEMIVFKGFDSASPDAAKTLHVAFEDTTQPRAIPRVSLETRYFALFD